MRTFHVQKGFTLIELMVGLVVGLLVTAIIVTTFSQTKYHYSQDESIARLQENGRFASQMLAREISMAGYIGRLHTGDVGTYPAAADACMTSLDWFNPTAPIIVYDATNLAPTSCVNNTLAGTQVLVIKRGEGKRATDYASASASVREKSRIWARSPGNTYDFAIASADTAIADMTTVIDTGETNADDKEWWEYHVTLFYIKNNQDGIPTLYRKRSQPDGSGGVEIGPEEALIEGVANYRILAGLDAFGYDSAGSFTSDARYRDGIADNYTVITGTTDLANIVSARLDVLMLSPDPDYEYTNTKSYLVAETSVAIPTSLEHHYGRVFNAMAQIRNRSQRIQMGLASQNVDR